MNLHFLRHGSHLGALGALVASLDLPVHGKPFSMQDLFLVLWQEKSLYTYNTQQTFTLYLYSPCICHFTGSLNKYMFLIFKKYTNIDNALCVFILF